MLWVSKYASKRPENPASKVAGNKPNTPAPTIQGMAAKNINFRKGASPGPMIGLMRGNTPMKGVNIKINTLKLASHSKEDRLNLTARSRKDNARKTRMISQITHPAMTIGESGMIKVNFGANGMSSSDIFSGFPGRLFHYSISTTPL
jgi:hypothetical protein